MVKWKEKFVVHIEIYQKIKVSNKQGKDQCDIQRYKDYHSNSPNLPYVHLTVLGLQVVATTFEGSAQGFQTHLLWLTKGRAVGNFKRHILTVRSFQGSRGHW